MTDYYIDVDEEDWIGVPPAFPYLHWENASAWANEIAHVAVLGDETKRQEFLEIAERVASERPPNVEHILWFAPHDGRGMGVAYLSVAVVDGALPSLKELALLGIDSATPAQVTSHDSNVFDRVVQSATTIRLSDVGEGPSGPVAGSLRFVAVGGGYLFMLNSIDEDLHTLALMQEPMLEVFERIVFAHTDDEKDAAAHHLEFDGR